MKKVFPFFGSLIVILMFGSFAASAPVSAPQASGKTLDQKKIHSEYNEGDFERVIATLEGFMARNSSYSHSDSVFIAKHLAVVYSANPGTREKGRYFMYRLLELLPSAKLIDMYVSDEIDRIFEKVREEFIARQNSFGVDTHAMKVPTKAPATDSRDQNTGEESKQPREKQKSNGGKVYWLAGGAMVVAASVATYYVLGSDEEPEEKTYVVP